MDEIEKVNEIMTQWNSAK